MLRRKNHIRNKLVVALLMLGNQWSPVASAELAPSFPELIRQAERSSPQLQEIEANVNAAQGRAKQSAAFPNPSLNFELEDFAGSGSYRGSSRSQATLSISEPLEIGGQRGARIAAGRATLAAAQAKRIQERANFGYDLAIAYVTAEAAQRRIELLSDDVNRAQEDLRSARALVQAGKEGELRSVQAEAAASTAAAELETARADAIAVLTKLSTAVGMSDPYTGIRISLLNTSPRVDANTVGEKALPSVIPAVTAAQAERDAAESNVTVERRRAIPSPSLSIGTRQIREEDATTWVAGISVPLPLFDRNRGAIAAARAELNAAEARLSAAKLNNEAEWRVTVMQVNAMASRLNAAEQAGSSANEAYRLARIGYEAGRTPLFELSSTRRALTDAQLRLLEARLARVRAEASLARLAGRIPFVE